MQQNLFGGSWTEEKLACLSEYLEAYNTALKHQPFRRVYIDAFAGTGSREAAKVPASEPGGLEFSLVPAADQVDFFRGSARRAAETGTPFHELYLIERSKKKCAELEKLRISYPDRRITVRQGDANTEIRRICESFKWHEYPGIRAVLFMDPFGCNVDWETIEAIAKTRAIDMWYLFPSGIGINRMLTKDRSRLPPSWEKRLDKNLGTKEWREVFYGQVTSHSLLGGTVTETYKAVTIAGIEQFFLRRLGKAFPMVSERALPLMGPTGSQLFSLCFACANPRAKQAVEIANYLLDPERKWRKAR